MAAVGGIVPSAGGHDVITTKLTWSKEVSRVVYRNCLACHREGGKAFSLLQYGEARPWAKAIQESVLRRQMPPWDAVKGFGEFRHELGLSQEDIHTISDWVEGGAPEGDPALLPARPRPAMPSPPRPAGEWLAPGRWTGTRVLLGVDVSRVAKDLRFKLVAETPAGERLPILWIEGHSMAAPQFYGLAKALRLPAGTKISSYPPVDGLRLLAAPGSPNSTAPSRVR